MNLNALLTFSFVVLLLNGGPVIAIEAPQKAKASTTHSHSASSRHHIEIKNRAMAQDGNQENIADVEGLGSLISEMSLSVNIEDVWSVCSSSCTNNPSDCGTASICVNGDCQELPIPNDRATFLWCARDAMFHNDDLFDFLQYSRSDCTNNDDGYCSDGVYRRGCKLLLCGENPLTKCLSNNGDSCAGY